MARIICGLVTVLALVFCGSALATDRYVNVATGSDGLNGGENPCDNPVTPCKTLSWAVGNSAADDTIHVAPGTYPQPLPTVHHPLNLVGAGSGSDAGANTIVSPASGVALSMFEGGSVTGMRLVGGADAAGKGLVLGAESAGQSLTYAIGDVVAIGGLNWAGADAPGLEVSDAGAAGATISATLQNVTVSTGQWAQPIALVTGANVGATFTDSTIDIPAIAQGMWVRGGASVVFSRSQTLQHNDGFNESGLGLKVRDQGSALTVDRSRVVSGRGAVSVDNGGSVLVRNSLVAQLRTVLPADASDNAAIFVSSNSGAGAQATIIGSTVVGHGPNSDAALRVGVVPAGGAPSATVHNSVLRNVDTTSDGASADVISDVFMNAGTATITADHSAYSTVITAGGGTATPAGSGSNVTGDPLFANAPSDFTLQPGSPLIDAGDPAAASAGELDLLGNARSLDSNHDCVAAPEIGAYEITGNELATCPATQGSGGNPAGDPAPTGQQPVATDSVAPLLGTATFAPRRFAVAKRSTALTARVRRGSALRFTLSERADVTIVIQRRVGKRWRKAATLVRKGVPAGKAKVAFTGRIGRRALKPGSYRAVVTAKDQAGNRSKAKTAAFTIVRG